MDIDPRLHPIHDRQHSHHPPPHPPPHTHTHTHRSDPRPPPPITTRNALTTAYTSPASGPSTSPGTTASSAIGPSPHNYPEPPAYNHHPRDTDTHDDNNDNDNDNDPYGLKRPRACEACRHLKVRCEPDPRGNNEGRCKRCAKTGRECVVTAPTRKRQKKTDSRVAELERKIDALTARLQPGSTATATASGTGGQRARRWLGARQDVPSTGVGLGLSGVKRRYSGEVKESRSEGSPGYPSSVPKAWRWGGFAGEAPSSSSGGGSIVDMIDKGFVSVEAATEAFERYVNDMAPHLPIVVFPPGTQMNEIRRSKPVLFNAIVAVSIGPIQPDIQLVLIEDFYKVIAERVVVKGEKSLDLVQAIIVCTIWYIPPDHFEELKFYQLTHMAVTLAMDIGMVRWTKTAKRPFNLLKDVIGKKAFFLNPDSPETRRTWLGLYYLSVQVSAALRRIPLVRWHAYMDECIEILETSPDALPSDKALIRWVKLTQIMEEVCCHFVTDEPDLGTTSEPKIHYALKVFERQLEQWRKETPAEHYSLTMKQTDYLLNIYIHEPTMHINGNGGEKPAEAEYPNPAINASYITALSTCLTCTHRALDVILSLPSQNVLHLPTYVVARASYAMVALIRLYAIVSPPDSQIGQVIDPASLKTDYYLGRIVEHYKAAGEHVGGRTPGKFSVVLDMLRNWFVKQKDQTPSLKDALDGRARSSSANNMRDSEGGQGQGQEETHSRMGPTPLHLLSEVAMGEPKSRPGSNHLSPFPHQRASSGYYTSTPHPHPTSIDSLVSQPLPSSTSAMDQPQQQQPWMQYQMQYNNPNNQLDPSSTYPDPNAPTTTAYIPELGLPVGVGFQSENLFTLGDMLGDGFFNFPFSVDGGVSW